MAGLVCAAVGLLTAAVVSPAILRLRHQANLTQRLLLPGKAVTYQTTMVVEQLKRKVYPYSIVPGGAENVHEAKWAMSDPAVQGHYAKVNLAQLKQVTLKTDMSGYLSYRWGNKIYWTAKKVTLHAGEAVFTDGTNVVRGRCLNCYSALPMAPIRPQEPTEAVLDAPSKCR